MNKTNSRNSNLELYRIIVMFAIVCHHYVVNSGLMEIMGGGKMLDLQSVFYYVFGAWGKTGINCFILITGYFMCQSNITLRKFLKLYLQVVFYLIVGYIIFCIVDYQTFSFKSFVLKLLPFRCIKSDSFTQSFLVWWLFIPFLNVVINNISKRQHKLLILLTVSIFTVYNYLPTFEIEVNPICWFSTLFFIASYLRLHYQDNPLSKNQCFWGVATFISLLLGVVSIVGTLWFDSRYGKDIHPYWLVSDSNAPLALLISVTSFMFFKNFKLGPSKFINAIGSTTFGILLIHANSGAMRQWLWKDTIDCVGHYNSSFYYAPLAVLTVFSVCSIIDYLRLKTLEKPSINLSEKIINIMLSKIRTFDR